MKSLLIQNGRIIDPGRKLDEVGSLLIAGGKISWVGRAKDTPPDADYDVLDAKGLIVCPGFIDLHCHLRQPGFEGQETIATGTMAAARGGFTTVCCMPNTEPPLDNKSTIDYVKSTAAAEGIIRVLPIGCISRGRMGEEPADMDELAAAGVVAFSDDGEPVLNPELMRRALEYSCSSGLPIIDHCEDKTLSEGGQMNEGKISAELELKGIPDTAEESIVARDLDLTEKTGGWVHIAHVSTGGAVDLIRRAKEKGVRVTAEATPHHLTLTEERVKGCNTSAKVNPPLRTERDVKALIKGLKDNTIDIIATDHAPHTEAEKRQQFDLAPFGISGFETALGSLMGLVHRGDISLVSLINKLTAAPAEIIGKKYGPGTLAIGAPADVTIFDPNLEWTVDTKDFASKGKNTPLAGEKLKGRVVATIYGGKVVYRDEGVTMKGRETIKR
ncbi:MAG: dihydroorotase [Deltaproteobacteria bacterium]|nr:dihydroorotase [Deltaproteobacteria bacterium]